MTHRTSQQAGFTLVELMVSISIFVIVVTVGIGAITSITGANRSTRGQRAAIDSISFVLDAMARTIRTGNSFDCGNGENVDCYGTANSELRFFDQNENLIIYGLSGDEIVRTVLPPNQSAQNSNMTNGGVVQIDRLNFYTRGLDDDVLNDIQPAVTVVISGTIPGTTPPESVSMQTTVTQRLLDVNEAESVTTP